MPFLQQDFYLSSGSSSFLTPNYMWLKFSEAQTSTALDSSGNGYNGQSYYTNAWVITPTGGAAFRFGTYSNIMTFAATNIPSSGTVLWWAYPLDPYNNSQYEIEWGNLTSGTQQGLEAVKYSNNIWYFGWYGGSGHDYRLSVAANAANWHQNAWNFYAETYNPTTGVAVYSNGVFWASNDIAVPNTYNGFGQYMQLGGNSGYPVGTAGVDAFNGYITDFRFFSNVLTAAQIATIYAAGSWAQTNTPTTDYNALNFLPRINCITNTAVWTYILEPRVIYTNSQFCMWMTIKTNTDTTLGECYYMTSPNGTNSWTTPVPVVGKGYGGVSGTARGVSVVSNGNGYFLFYTDESSTYRITLDGSGTNIIAGPTLVISATAFGNQTAQSQLGTIVVSNLVMYSLNNPFIPNGRDPSFGGQWLCQAIYSLNNGLTWQTNSPLMGWMGPSYDGAYSGITLVLESGGWHIFGQGSSTGATIGHSWYHYITSSPGTFSSGTIANGGLPAFDLNGENIRGTLAQQLADPDLVQVGGQTFIYYDVNANNNSAYIDVVVYNGPISNL